MPKCSKCGRWRLFSSQLHDGLCANCFANAQTVKVANSKPVPSSTATSQGQEPPIPESEKRFYQPDDYYEETDLAGNRVIPFEQRKSGWKSKKWPISSGNPIVALL